jgi:hypothetical protein
MKINLKGKSNYSKFLQKGAANIQHIVHVEQQHKDVRSALWYGTRDLN